MASTAYEKLKDANALPSPTGVALKLLRLAGDQDATVEAIAAIIESDPALAGRVLKLANSPLAGTARRIGSISNAVVLLGMRTLKNLALGISLISNNRAGRCEGFDFEGFWRESVARAVAARHLAARLGGFQPDEAFTVGLLGKVGQLALANGYPDLYAQALARAQVSDRPALIEIEKQLFGVDDNELSAEMMSSWYLPDALCSIVRNQDSSDARIPDIGAQSDRIIAILRLARLIAITLNQSQATAGVLAELERQAGTLGIASEALVGFLDTVREEWLETTGILSLKPEAAPKSERTRVESDNKAAAPGPAQRLPQPPGGDPLRILIVDDDPDSLRLLATHLTSHGYQVMTAADGNEALAVDQAQAPQMIITDWMMPGLNGLELCRTLRAQESAGLVYIIILTAHSERARVVEALNAGADEFLRKPYSRDELLARVRAGERVIRLKADLDARALEVSECNVKLAAYNERLHALATQDELTGLFNRREAMTCLAEHWALSVRQERPLSCVMADIDHFKRFNDEYGHATGDRILVETANRLRVSVRGGEKLCRFGGEEFLIICPGSPAAAAQGLAERLRKAVGSSPIRINGLECVVTISLGAAERTAYMTSLDQLLAASDAALYAAKRAGRNQACVASASDRSVANRT